MVFLNSPHHNVWQEKPDRAAGGALVWRRMRDGSGRLAQPPQLRKACIPRHFLVRGILRLTAQWRGTSNSVPDMTQLILNSRAFRNGHVNRWHAEEISDLAGLAISEKVNKIEFGHPINASALVHWRDEVPLGTGNMGSRQVS